MSRTLSVGYLPEDKLQRLLVGVSNFALPTVTRLSNSSLLLPRGFNFWQTPVRIYPFYQLYSFQSLNQLEIAWPISKGLRLTCVSTPSGLLKFQLLQELQPLN